VLFWPFCSHLYIANCASCREKFEMRKEKERRGEERKSLDGWRGRTDNSPD
jgi:hypothetical protein